VALVPGEPAFPDRDAAAEVTDPLGTDSSPERAVAARNDDCLRPQTDLLFWNGRLPIMISRTLGGLGSS
jgi:hypothetical protein